MYTIPSVKPVHRVWPVKRPYPRTSAWIGWARMHNADDKDTLEFVDTSYEGEEECVRRAVLYRFDKERF